jgi:hypothetical protein
MIAIPDQDDLWDSLWHGCVWAAYFDQMAEEGRFPPDSEATRRRAYDYYEQALREKNAAKAVPGRGGVDQPSPPG